MRTLSAPTLAALDSGRYIRRNLVRFDLDAGDGGSQGIWDDLYDINVSGVVYRRAAGRFLITNVASVGDYSVRSLDVVLSGLDAGALASIRTYNWHQRPVAVLMAIAPVETPETFDVVPWFTGHLDRGVERERAGGTFDFMINCESANRELGRKSLRLRSDADQRQIESNDGFFQYVTQTIQDDLMWGRTATAAPATKAPGAL